MFQKRNIDIIAVSFVCTHNNSNKTHINTNIKYVAFFWIILFVCPLVFLINVKFHKISHYSRYTKNISVIPGNIYFEFSSIYQLSAWIISKTWWKGLQFQDCVNFEYVVLKVVILNNSLWNLLKSPKISDHFLPIF